MIQPLITLVILVPIIIGILSVDVTGKPMSIREILRSDMMQNMTEIIEIALPTTAPVPPVPPEQYLEEEIEPPTHTTHLIDVDLSESLKALNELNSNVAQGVTFLLFEVKNFGVWIGVSTAPFHYLVALVVGFLLFPYWWLYITGFFVVIIKDRKEIFQEMKNARRRVPING